MTQYSFTDTPGRWDHWPSTFLFTNGDEDGVDGKVVVDRGASSSRRFCATSRSPSNSRSSEDRSRTSAAASTPTCSATTSPNGTIRGDSRCHHRLGAQRARPSVATGGGDRQLRDGGTLAVRERDVLDRTESGSLVERTRRRVASTSRCVGAACTWTMSRFSSTASSRSRSYARRTPGSQARQSSPEARDDGGSSGSDGSGIRPPEPGVQREPRPGTCTGARRSVLCSTGPRSTCGWSRATTTSSRDEGL